MKQIPVSLLTLTAGVLVTLISLWVGQHHGLLPEQASAQAPLVDGFFNVMVTIGTALFLVVQGAIVIFSILFRKRQGDETDGLPIEGNFSLEMFWTAIPALIVIGLGIYSVEVYQQMGGFDSTGSMLSHVHAPTQVAHHPATHRGSAIAAPLTTEAMNGAIAETTAAPPATPTVHAYGIGATPEEGNKAAEVVVDVTGLQYAWLFNYPGRGITSSELHIPVGKDVQLNLAAQDVIHSFWVPQFRLKQDVLPGMKNELRFVATKVGTFPVVCAELCGSYHGSMRTQVIVESPEDYDRWLAENQIAQQSDLQHAIATQPAALSTPEFLAPYAHEVGLDATQLAPLHP